MSLPRFLSRRWWKTSLIVMLAMGVMARLGIWQLDRLAQRRAFNARVEAQISQPVFELRDAGLKADLQEMEYREVEVVGEYDFAREVALRNQAWNNRSGVHLITPLRIANSDQFVLVDRGWIPYEDYVAGHWEKFSEPGEVLVNGVIRRSQEKADFGWRTDPTPAPGEARLTAWNLVNVARIGEQLPYPLLPVYIQQTPESGWEGLPYRSQPEVELSEGPHLGYALQWFTFAVVLGIGYPFYIRREEQITVFPKEQSKEMHVSSSGLH